EQIIFPKNHAATESLASVASQLFGLGCKSNLIDTMSRDQSAHLANRQPISTSHRFKGAIINQRCKALVRCLVIRRRFFVGPYRLPASPKLCRLLRLGGFGRRDRAEVVLKIL